MFKEPYESTQSTHSNEDQYRKLVDTETHASSQRHKENLKLAWTSMAGGFGVMLLGLIWLTAGLLMGRIYFYPFWLIGGGFVGFVSSIGYYQRFR
ncbi:hypothetical protein [Bremerella alba]|uniref:Uncharacterized protein n=1 Tax=Bremerella alba TaxID=980252 RepID=A0A7V9A5X1_9BACT|nr:hypothetical protein [Bremerella alba]MBA2113678.1 hypothetical protein [Bremerella alba]